MRVCNPFESLPQEFTTDLQYRIFGAYLVNLKVGKNEDGEAMRSYAMHLDLLNSVSGYFDEQFSDSQDLRLPEVSPVVFDIFFNWAYGVPIGFSISDSELTLAHVIQAYDFAEKIGCIKFQNAVMDYIQISFRDSPDELTLEDAAIFAEATKNSLLLKLLAAGLKYQFFTGWINHDEVYQRFMNCTQLSRQYLLIEQDLVNHCVEITDPAIRPGTGIFTKCYFHVHGEGHKTRDCSTTSY